MMWWNGEAGWAGWLLMSMGMLVFWALVVLAVIALIPGVRNDRHRWSRGPEQDEPLRVLDERLARGETGLEDYESRRALLNQPR